MTKLPTRPKKTVATDLKGPFPIGEYILVIINYYSRYPAIAVLNEITLESDIQAFQENFAVLGYPETVTSDNGTHETRHPTVR